MLLARSPPPASPARYPALGVLGARGPFSGAVVSMAGGGGGAKAPAAGSFHGQKHKQVVSVSNPLVKHCVKLRLSASYRRSCRRVLLVGLAPILEICRFEQTEEDPEFSVVEHLLLLDGVEVPKELHKSTALVVYVSAAVMKKVSGMQSVDSTEAIAIMNVPKSFCNLESNEDEAILDSLFHSPNRILVLDGIQDPGNLGTLIRSARAFKWDGVFLLPACCDPFNEKAIRAARGASFQLPILSGNWSNLKVLVGKYNMKMLAGHPSDGLKASSFLSRELADSLSSKALCLVLGSEGNGLSAEARKVCELVNIPMEGTFESLNVSVAGGIFLFMLQPKKQEDSKNLHH